MSKSPFVTPKPRAERKRKAGGDNEVERDGMGRPRIIVACDVCPGTGQVPSTKRPGKMNKCLRCSGQGQRKVSYTRVTTLAETLEDKKNLTTWENRMVLLGAARDTGFLKDVAAMDPDEDKETLNRRAEAAKELAGASKKSEHGTFLHELSELVDVGDELPYDLDPDDYLDIVAYAEATQPLLHIVHMEQLVVCDKYRTAGTPDRISRVRDDVTLRAPDGHEFTPDELIITDLKTGRIDYGGLKMSSQLSIYANSMLYDKKDGARIEIENLNKEWGLIMHAPAGANKTTLYWADLRLGWAAVGLAVQVRETRTRGRKALTEVSPDMVLRAEVA